MLACRRPKKKKLVDEAASLTNLSTADAEGLPISPAEAEAEARYTDAWQDARSAVLDVHIAHASSSTC